MTLLELSGFMQRTAPLRDVTKKELMERSGVSAAIIGALEKRGIVRQTSKVISRFDPVDIPTGELPVLSDAQAEALREIHNSWI